ncbi:hypothetical protein ACLMJK_004272 [Lecanora helva]
MEFKWLQWITLILQSTIFIRAFPTTPQLSELSLPNPVDQADNATQILGNFLQPSNLTARYISFPVPNTPITLRLVLFDRPLAKSSMEHAILQIQVKLRTYIRTHYQADKDVLFPSDDPYTSDLSYQACYLAFTTWPPNRQKRLTYGMLDDALKGVWEFLYRGERFQTADFFIAHDEKGMVGYGRVDGKEGNRIGLDSGASLEK